MPRNIMQFCKNILQICIVLFIIQNLRGMSGKKFMTETEQQLQNMLNIVDISVINENGNQQIMRQHIRRLEIQNAQLKSDVQSKEKALESQKKTMKTLQSFKELQNRKVNSYEQQLKQLKPLEQENIDLKNKLKSMSSLNKSDPSSLNNEKVEQLNIGIQRRLQAQIQKEKEQNRLTLSKLHKSEKQKDSLIEDIRNQRDQQIKLQKRTIDYEEQIKKKTKEIEDLGKSKSSQLESSKRILQLEKDLSNIVKQSQQKTKQIQKLNKIIKELQNIKNKPVEPVNNQKEMAVLDNQIKSLRSELTKAKEQKNNMEEDNKINKQKISKLKKQISQLEYNLQRQKERQRIPDKKQIKNDQQNENSPDIEAQDFNHDPTIKKHIDKHEKFNTQLKSIITDLPVKSKVSFLSTLYAQIELQLDNFQEEEENKWIDLN